MSRLGRADEIVARTADGVALAIDHVPAIGASRGALVCLHAMMTDGRYFGTRRERSFATEMAALGFDVFVADFRGHGHSELRAGRDDWSFDDLVELDLPAIVGAIGRTDITLLGHSLGGLVACAALATGRIPPPRSLILAATSVWLGETRGRRALMTAYRAITAAVGKAPIRALRAGHADEAKGYVAQLTGWARGGRWTSLRGIDYTAALDAIDTPAFALCGAGDCMCRPADAERIAGRLRGCPRLRIVGRSYGDALDPDHFQLFTRAELLPVWRELADHTSREMLSVK